MSSTPRLDEAAPPSPPWSLALRLTVWYATSAFALVFFTTGFLYWSLCETLDREDDEHLFEETRQIAQQLADPERDPLVTAKAVVEGPGGKHLSPFSVRILNEAGATLVESAGMSELLPSALFPTPVSLSESLVGSDVVSLRGRAARVVSVLAPLGPRKGPHILQVAFDRASDEELLAGYRKHLFAVLGVSLAACAIGSHQIARHGLRPVSAIAATARRIRFNNLTERIEARRWPAELAELAWTINHMLDRLQESFSRLSQFSADIAHELRTPVNNMRGEAEVALGRLRSGEEYRETLSSCLEECDRLTRLIDSLLFLARAEGSQTAFQRETLELAAEIDRVRDFHEAQATEKGVRLEAAVEPGANVRADRTLLQRALGNLIANAIAHTPRGGCVGIRAGRNGSETWLVVEDTGEGIAPEHLPRVFDRFYRADSSRNSSSGRTGLGLAIVRGIVRMHRGEIKLSSEAGKGTRVELTFPFEDEVPERPLPK